MIPLPKTGSISMNAVTAASRRAYLIPIKRNPAERIADVSRNIIRLARIYLPTAENEAFFSLHTKASGFLVRCVLKNLYILSRSTQK